MCTCSELIDRNAPCTSCLSRILSSMLSGVLSCMWSGSGLWSSRSGTRAGGPSSATGINIFSGGRLVQRRRRGEQSKQQGVGCRGRRASQANRPSNPQQEATEHLRRARQGRRTPRPPVPRFVRCAGPRALRPSPGDQFLVPDNFFSPPIVFWWPRSMETAPRR